MKDKNKILPAILGGAILSSAFLSGITLNSFAEGSSSYFDENAKQCVIDSYNATNGTSITEIEDVDFDKVTALNCANRNIVNFRGIVLFKNLLTLDLNNNSNLSVYQLEFAQNTKLRSLSIANISGLYSLDLSNNPDIRYIASGGYLGLTLSTGVEKLNNGEEYAYGIDLNNYQWYSQPQMNGRFTINEEMYPYQYDEETGIILFKDRNKIPYSVTFHTNYGDYNVSTRRGSMNYRIFLSGDADIEAHNPVDIYNNCKELTYTTNDGSEGKYYACDNSVYSGDTFDTDEIVDNTLTKMFNLSEYELSSVEVVPPTAKVELETDEERHKSGTILADASFTLDFHFNLKKAEAKTPNTGFFSNEDGTLKTENIFLSVAGISILGFMIISISHRVMKRAKAKRF